MIEIREFQPSDAFAIELRPEDTKRALYRDRKGWNDIVENSIAYTLLYNDEILCCGGVCIFREHFGEAWILCSCKVEKHSLVAIRATKMIIENIISTYGIYRVQASIRCDWKRARRFIEFLGFQKEGIMRRYGPDGKDYILYARIA
jgi:hypothetical protein